jgi:hypothetical protein
MLAMNQGILATVRAFENRPFFAVDRNRVLGAVIWSQEQGFDLVFPSIKPIIC